MRRCRTAFGLSAGPAPDRFLVGLAVLSLLSEVAEEQPLVCLVDDEQWLDRASAQALGFVARRLEADSVGLVFAARVPGEELAGLPELVIEGLREDDARALLDSVLTGPLDARVRDRIVAETRGNPLALLELPRGLTPAELAGGFGLPGAAPMLGRIEESFRRRIEALPGREPAAAAGRGGRSDRRPGAGVAGSRAARDRCSGGGAGGRGRAGRVRRPGAVPSSAGAFGGLPVGVGCRTGRRCTARWPRSPTRRPIRTAGPGTGLRPRPGRMRTSPRSWSARPAGRRPAAAWPRRPRSWSARRSLTPDPVAGRSGCSRRRRPNATPARWMRHSGCWSRSRPGRWTQLRTAEVEHLRGQIALDQRRGSDAARLLLSAARRLEPLNAALARETYLEALGRRGVGR